MALTLHFHPLASFCHKALIALYELDIGFEPVIVDLGDPGSRAAFAAVWPPLKFPVLTDAARGTTVAESTIVVEYLDAFYGGGRLVPADPGLAWQARMWDRLFDQYLEVPMQKVVGDALRPQGAHDPHGVAEARAALRDSYRFLGARLGDPWALGERFGLADCAAAPALFYADLVEPLGPEDATLRGYLGRLMRRPSFARVLAEAEPFFGLFPLDPKPSRTPPA